MNGNPDITYDTPGYEGIPTLKVNVGDSIVDIMLKLGFAKSKREARYFITHGAVRLWPCK